VRPCPANVQEGAQPAHAGRIEPVRRLVEDQELWLAEQGCGEAEPLAHAERVGPHPPLGCAAQFDQLEHLPDPAGREPRALDPAVKAAGLEDVTFHTLRHTAASAWFARGASLVQVQRLLGHHSPAFTLATYVHLLGGDDLPDSELLADLVADPGRPRSALNVR
jgi:hypothetical protein